MPDHVEDDVNWTAPFYYQNPYGDRGWKRWVRKRTIGEMAMAAFVLRLFQLVLEGLLCGLATWRGFLLVLASSSEELY